MVHRTRPNAEGIERARKDARSKRISVGLPAVAEGDEEYEAAMALREERLTRAYQIARALERIEWAAYHNDPRTAEAARKAAKLRPPDYQRAWRAGRASAAAGEPCSCPRCSDKP